MNRVPNRVVIIMGKGEGVVNWRGCLKEFGTPARGRSKIVAVSERTAK